MTDATCELIQLQARASYDAPFRILMSRVRGEMYTPKMVSGDNNEARDDPHGPIYSAIATIKMDLAGDVDCYVAEGEGEVFAIDAVFRQALVPCFPAVVGLNLIEFSTSLLPGCISTSAPAVTTVVYEFDGSQVRGTGTHSSLTHSAVIAVQHVFSLVCHRQKQRGLRVLPK